MRAGTAKEIKFESFDSLFGIPQESVQHITTILIYLRRKLVALMKSWKSFLKCSGIFRGVRIIVGKTRV